MPYGLKAFDIVGYTFKANQYHPHCILDQLPTGPGEAFDGWDDVTGKMTAEENLHELAAAFQIDRENEHSFDSDDFPKVIFASQVEDSSEVCGGCGRPLIGDPEPPPGKYIITVDGEEMDHAETLTEARRNRDTIIYGEIGTQENTKIQRRP
jgi:hypothetical protein